MTRSAVAATAVTALLLVGCGHAVRDSVKTSGEAAERAVREWERSQSALVLAEDARNAARDAAASAADPPALGNRDDFIEELADDARDRADDAQDRADDVRDRAKDVRDRARDAEEGAKKASEWMAGKGFYTSEQYWDCDRYRRHEAFEDQPEACRHANEARALAEVVRWRANRAQTVAEHARALAYETRSLAQRAEAERRTGGRRGELLAEAEQLQEQAADTLAAVREAYAEQNREWQGLQARAARWLEDAERTYAAIKQDDGGGGWASALLGGAIGAVAGAAGASALGLTGSEALELATVTTVAGAEAGAGGDGTLTQAAVDAVSDGGVTPPVAGTAAGTDPALNETLDSIAAGLLTRADGGRAGAGAFDAGVRTPEEAPGAPGRRRSPAGGVAGGGDTAANAFDALDRAFAADADAGGFGADTAPVDGGGSSGDTAATDAFAALERAFAAEAADSTAESVPASDGNPDATHAFAALEQAFAAEADAADRAAAGGGRGSADTADRDPFAALEQAFAAERDAEAANDEDEGGAVDTEPIDPVVEDAFAALEQAFAAEAAELSADEETNDRNADAASENAHPFAAPEQAFVAEVPEEVREDAAAAVVDAVPEPAESADAFAALEQAFAVEVADDVAQGDEANVVDAAPEPTAAHGSASTVALVVPLDVETAADPPAYATPEPANLAEWVRAVSAGVTAAEEAAGEAESAAAGTGSWFARTAACVNARDRLSNALQRVERLTVGEGRPLYVTAAAGEETYTELGERLDSAGERGRAACESIGRPQ